MASIIEKVILFPAFLMFVLSAFLGFLTLQDPNLSSKTNLLNYATTLFIAGALLSAIGIVAWIVRRGSENL